MEKYSIIGKSVPRVDALEKVRGAAKFCADLKMPGMLIGKVKRCPHPFARVLSVDTRKARKLAGVKAVVTAWDVNQFPYGVLATDEIPLCKEYARYIGDEIVGVAAIDEDTVEEALDLIEVEYEELSPVFDPERAMDTDAPQVHPELKEVKHNVAYHIDYARGNGQALMNADFVIEDRFSTPIQHHGYLEPQACIADWGTSGKLTLWIPCQTPFPARATIARALGISGSQVRIIQTYVGGGFGGKGQPKHFFHISAFLSKRAGKPVKIVLSRSEDFATTRPAVPELIDLRLGFNRDGSLVGKDVVITADAGAYVGTGFAVLDASAVRTGSLYRIPNIKMVANLVYTNKVPTGSLRGFGNPQTHFAMESLMDMAAEELGIDPLELRLKNVTQKGDITAHGWIINSCGLSESLKLSAAKSKWRKKRKQGRKNRGIGVACMIHASGNRAINPVYDGSSAIIRMDEFGKIKVISGEVELGQGASTVFAQIAAEELGIPLEDIKVLPVDTDLSPFCIGSVGSRGTTIGGNAVRMAAKDVKKQLLGYAAEELGTKARHIGIEERRVYSKTAPDKGISIEDLAFASVLKKRGGAPIIGIGSYVISDPVVLPDRETKYGNLSVGYTFGTQIVEVSVDPETGKVDVLHVWSAYDIGRVINPIAAEGQMEGGVMQAIGFALSEEYLMERGKMLNANFHDYKIPNWMNMPKIDTFFIETKNPGSPYGVKGLGESTVIPTPPAIANAIYDAVGVRIKELPITPEKVLEAMKREGGEEERNSR
jgi:CO/xanthine dehydrogenase Mo-binding subunit